MITIHLAAIHDSLADAWLDHCGDLEFVQVHRGSILDVDCDAIVSPANSFGFMNGGVDALYTKHFGPQLEERLQRVIQERHGGELLIGQAEMIPTGARAPRFLIAAPTMRYPLTIRDTVNPYLAARAVLRLCTGTELLPGSQRLIRDEVSTVAFPGLGTGIGRVSPTACARQVREAIDGVLLGKTRFPNSWGEVMQQQERLTGLDLSE